MLKIRIFKLHLFKKYADENSEKIHAIFFQLKEQHIKILKRSLYFDVTIEPP